MILIPVEPKTTEYLYRKAAKNKMPLSGSFELTPVCNMDCKMCYVRMSKKQQEATDRLRTKEEWIELAKEAKKLGTLYLLLTGGEPFLREDFKEILDELHHLGFIISINSNGTLINQEVVEWLKETPPARINITLYGASDETYEKLCGNPKGFTQVSQAIRLLKEAGITIKLNCSLTPYNVHDLEKMIDFAKKEQLIIQPSAYMFPPLRKDASMIGKNDRFTPVEAAYYSAKIEALLNGDDYFLEKMKNQDLSLPSDEDCAEIEGEGIRCRAGKCSFWVTWNGKLLPCGMLPGKNVPSVFDIGMNQAWKLATDFASQIRLPGKCAACSIKEQCKACAAMVLTETGNFTTVPKYRCDMSKAYIEEAKKVEREILEKRLKDEEQ